ncbi:conserved Plasmodium protein, unknown function [Plasmodium reichenowi]|uniref:Uncharacterized protein n=1 Tax=Plasmodium reichenowi TaxID=5854 RepID=A0A2P9D962_PLARE|nr:conserved Plasmodium protein, unknown function [Plasmodium reichenowi]
MVKVLIYFTFVVVFFFHIKTLGFKKNSIIKQYNLFSFLTCYKDISIGNRIRKKRNNKLCNNILNYNIYIPNNMKVSNINLKNNVFQIINFPLSTYNIISIDYGYNFMGLCILCKNKYIYEKVFSRHKNILYKKQFELPIKENVHLFYVVNFQNYIYNFFSFFHYLFEFIYNTNLLVIIGSNGSHMDELVSDMGKHICLLMNEKRSIPTNNLSFDVYDESITFKNDNMYIKSRKDYIEKYNFSLNENSIEPSRQNEEDNTFNFSLKNVVTKVKDHNNTLFSKFYNKNYKNRKDSISACYLLNYFLKYYDNNNNEFFLPSKNVHYMYHIKGKKYI